MMWSNMVYLSKPRILLLIDYYYFLQPILSFTNTNVSNTKMCLDISVFTKVNRVGGNRKIRRYMYVVPIIYHIFTHLVHTYYDMCVYHMFEPHMSVCAGHVSIAVNPPIFFRLVLKIVLFLSFEPKI
jgi:hypothetical protein